VESQDRKGSLGALGWDSREPRGILAEMDSQVYPEIRVSEVSLDHLVLMDFPGQRDSPDLLDRKDFQELQARREILEILDLLGNLDDLDRRESLEQTDSQGRQDSRDSREILVYPDSLVVMVRLDLWVSLDSRGLLVGLGSLGTPDNPEPRVPQVSPEGLVRLDLKEMPDYPDWMDRMALRVFQD